MRATTRLYLRYCKWPRADKALWQQAFEPKVDLFDGGGPGAHLSERSVQQLQYAYAKFLYFISAEHSDLLKRRPARRINARITEEYVHWQPDSCGGERLAFIFIISGSHYDTSARQTIGGGC